MKVIMLSQIDYAGSAFRTFEAIRRYTNININLFSGPPDNHLNHPIWNLVTKANRPLLQKLVNEADILHFKGDWPPLDGYLGLKIPDKPIVLTTSGTFFRKKIHGGFERFTVKDYYRATLKTSFEPDLLYPEYSDIWTPHPVDSDNKAIIKRDNSIPFFCHIPSTPERKGTEFVKRVFEILKRKINCRAEVITGVNFNQSLQIKQSVSIYFDQFMVGFYGNAALEAMQWGIPVTAWISPDAISQAKGKLKNCPLINEDQSDPLATAGRIIAAYRDQSLTEATKKWCDSIHGYKAIAEIWVKLYQSLL